MKNKSYIFLFLVVAIIIIAVLFVPKREKSTITSDNVNLPSTEESVVKNDSQTQVDLSAGLVDPLPDALARITKKPFGILIDRKTSPVQPERFSGYHTGVDLETTPDEQNIDVAVETLCDGKLLTARSASGYGGVAVQSCVLDGKAVTVVYGHINIASVEAKVGDKLKAGDFLANLGKGFSRETDGERKHLHLAIHLGDGVNILGYVQSKKELSAWLDPAKYL
jgi:hypothetical protein